MTEQTKTKAELEAMVTELADTVADLQTEIQANRINKRLEFYARKTFQNRLYPANDRARLVLSMLGSEGLETLPNTPRYINALIGLGFQLAVIPEPVEEYLLQPIKEGK